MSTRTRPGRPGRPRHEPVSEIGRMLIRAMDAKAEDTGGPYGLAELARDSHVDYSLASKVTRGERRPTAPALEAWAGALVPYFDLDAALLAAGHPPRDEQKAGVFRRLWRLTTEQWAQLEEWVGERATEHGPDDDAGDERDEGGRKI